MNRPPQAPGRAYRWLLGYQALAALAALLAACYGLWRGQWPGLWLHGWLVVGLLPLLIAAAPVVAGRLRPPAGLLVVPPLLQWMLLLGGGFLPRDYASIAPLGLLTVVALLGTAAWCWYVGKRDRRSAWYLTALAVLSLGLLPLLLMPFLLTVWPGLRGLHLHLALVGGLGLLGVGLAERTLVRAEPAALVAASLVLSLGGVAGPLQAPYWRLAGLAGGTLLAALLVRQWGAALRQLPSLWRRAPVGLAYWLALLGLLLALLAGVSHGVGRVAPPVALQVFQFCFLLPLLSGLTGEWLPWLLGAGPQRRIQRLAVLAAAAQLLVGLAVAAGANWGLIVTIALLFGQLLLTAVWSRVGD